VVEWPQAGRRQLVVEEWPIEVQELAVAARERRQDEETAAAFVQALT
jgi:hypothetical protein